MNVHLSLRALSWMCLLLCALGWSTASFAAPQLTIDTSSYKLVSSTRVGRTTFDYSFTVAITNSGTSALDVGATVTSSNPATAIASGSVNFGMVPAGATVTSTNTFTIQQDRTVTFDPAALSWTTQYSVPESPVANAGAGQVVNVGGTVELDGSQSIDPQGGPLSYQWQIRQRPTGSAAALSNAAAVRPTFIADVPGSYVLSLVVTDGLGVASAPATVTVVTAPGTVLPVANAGPSQVVPMGSVATLDGTGSSDASGYTLLFSWSLISIPSGSTATLSNADTPIATFTPDVSGTYVAQLTVSDQHGNVASSQATVWTTAPAEQPVANPGPDQLGSIGSPVTLDGSRSSDPNGYVISSYQWSLLAKPSSSQATLVSPTSPKASFVPDVSGDYVAQLVVGSNGLLSAPAAALISTSGVAPTANAGTARNVTAGDMVKLTGSGTDPSNRGLSYNWFFLALPSGSQAKLQNSATPTPSFVADVAGLYTAELIVNDGVTSSAPSNVNITAAAPDNADIGVTQSLSTPSPSTGQNFVITITVINNGLANATGVTVADQLPSGLALSSAAASQGSYSAATGSWTVGALTKGASGTLQLTVQAGKAGTYINTAQRLASQPPDLDSGNDTSSLTITVAPPNPVPTLLSVTPNTLLATGQAQSITLSGSNFVSSSNVYFGALLLAATVQNSTTITATVPGSVLTNSGEVPVTVFNPAPGGGSSAAAMVQVLGAKPAITSVSPGSASIGSQVTITGTGFDALNPGSNVVTFNGVQAVVVSATSTQIVAVVPVTASSGPISVSTGGGSATSSQPFTDVPLQDFDISLSPSTITAPLGSGGDTSVSLVSKGQNAYVQPVTLAVTGVPDGLTAHVNPGDLSVTNSVLVSVNATATVSPGSYPITITATGLMDATTVTRSQTLTVVVPAAGTTTVTGRVLHAENDQPFSGVSVTLGSQGATTDATGTYQFVNPSAAGNQVVLIDADRMNTETVNYPSKIPMPVTVVSGQDNPVPTAYIGAVDATKYTTIVPGEEAFVTQPNLPNYELHIPPGVTIYGIDGKPVTKINVRTVPVDKLPILPIPPNFYTKTVYLYYFFRPGGGTPTQPIPVTMANDLGAAPGEKVELYYYDESLASDPNSNQWKLMGTGTVSQDGKSIVSDPGVGIPKFCCGASFARKITASPPPPAICPTAGNPVSLSTGGATVITSRRFNLAGSRLPLSLSCGYNGLNSQIGFFGRGTFLSYDWSVQATGSQALTFTMPNGMRFTLSEDPDNIYRTTTGNPAGLGWEATVSGTTVTLRRKDGMVYQFNQSALTHFYAALLTSVQDPSGNHVTITRTVEPGNATSLTDTAGQVYTFDTTTIGSSVVATAIHDPIGRTWKFAYDSSGDLLSITDPAGNTESYAYSANGQIAAKTDARGNVTQYFYDSNGRAIKEILPNGGQWTFSYDVVAGNVVETQATDPDGNSTRYRFNGQQVLAWTIDALGRQTTLTIDYATNLVTASTDPVGRTTHYTYDSLGNLTSIVDPLGGTTLVEYDPTWNKPAKITNALGYVTKLAYDDHGNLVSVTDPTGDAYTLSYDSFGDLISITDPLGHTSKASYDEIGNLISLADALGNTSGAVYDDADRLTQFTDARGRSTGYSYDDLDRLTALVDALGGKTSWTYDALGNVLSVTDPRGNVLQSNTYDSMSRLIRSLDGTGDVTTYSYDPAGNLTSVTDRDRRTTEYSYDALNRVSGIQYSDGRTTDVTYDLGGNISKLSDSVSGDIVFSYDALNRVVAVDSDQGEVEYAYDVGGHRISRTINGVDPATYAYDPDGRLSSITYREQTITYTYDAAGRLIQRTLPNGVTETRNYDAGNRLLSKTYTTATGAALARYTYTYDADGNPVSHGGTAPPLAETPFTATYDADNRMTSFNGDGLTYDAEGKLLTRAGPNGATTYAWDARNELVGISGPFGTATFSYDALGRRVSSTINGETIGYLYDGWQEIAELSGSTIGTTYLAGLQLDEVLARYSRAGTRTLLTDAINTVESEVDEAQSISSSYAYSAFGQAEALAHNEGFGPRFAGREIEPTGLMYLRSRYYEPSLKRFVSADQIGLAGGINGYAYVGDNPLRFVDPSGNDWCPSGTSGVFCTVFFSNATPASTAVTVGCDIAGDAAAAVVCGETGPGVWFCALGVSKVASTACNDLLQPPPPSDRLPEFPPYTPNQSPMFNGPGGQRPSVIGPPLIDTKCPYGYPSQSGPQLLPGRQ